MSLDKHGEVEFDESSHLPDEAKMRLRKGLFFLFSPLKDFVDGFKGQVFEGAGMLCETLTEKGFMDALKAACSGAGSPSVRALRDLPPKKCAVMEALAQAVMPPKRGGEQRCSFARCLMEAAGEAGGLIKKLEPESIFFDPTYKKVRDELILGAHQNSPKGQEVYTYAIIYTLHVFIYTYIYIHYIHSITSNYCTLHILYIIIIL